jgi:hypothetical protein
MLRKHRDSLRHPFCHIKAVDLQAVAYEEHVESVLRRMSLHAPIHAMSDINDAHTRSSSGIGRWP